MKKLIISSLTFLLLIGCSSSNVKKNTIQMDKITWTRDSWVSEEEVAKQMTLFEIVPGPQSIVVETLKKPGETAYIIDMYLKVKLKHRVNIDIDKILSEDIDLAKTVANIHFLLLDRNGERIKVEMGFGAQDCFLILFNNRDFATEWFVDYLSFLQSEPGTEFLLHAWADFGEPGDRCSVGFQNLIKEVKGVEFEINSIDREFEKYIGVIE